MTSLRHEMLHHILEVAGAGSLGCSSPASITPSPTGTDAAFRVVHRGPLMKALHFARFGSPDVLDLVDRPIPQSTDDEVVVRVEAAAVQPSDVKSVAGGMEGDRLAPDTRARLHRRSGRGTEVAAGPGCVGDRR